MERDKERENLFVVTGDVDVGVGCCCCHIISFSSFYWLIPAVSFFL